MKLNPASTPSAAPSVVKTTWSAHSLGELNAARGRLTLLIEELLNVTQAYRDGGDGSLCVAELIDMLAHANSMRLSLSSVADDLAAAVAQ